MPIRPGDTFFAPFPDPPGSHHLFIVVSDPERNRDEVVIVPMMTFAGELGQDPTCRFSEGHRFIRHETYIAFDCTEVMNADHIEAEVDSRGFRTHDPVSADMLDKIREGAGRSDELALKYRDILEEQGLVDPL